MDPTSLARSGICKPGRLRWKETTQFTCRSQSGQEIARILEYIGAKAKEQAHMKAPQALDVCSRSPIADFHHVSSMMSGVYEKAIIRLKDINLGLMGYPTLHI